MKRASVKSLTTRSGAVAALAAAALLITGCASTKMQWWSWEMPGVGQEAEIERVTKRGSYLDATLNVEGEKLRFFFPSGYTCTQVIKPGATVDYIAALPGPGVRSSDGRCDPVGILSLAEWLKRYPREMTPGQPGREINFEVFYRDKDVALARGQFHFKGYRVVRELRPSGFQRSIAVRKTIRVIGVIPNSPECQKPLADGAATAEFHPDDPNPFQLRSGQEVCPLLGLTRTFEVPRPIGAGKRID